MYLPNRTISPPRPCVKQLVEQRYHDSGYRGKDPVYYSQTDLQYGCPIVDEGVLHDQQWRWLKEEANSLAYQVQTWRSGSCVDCASVPPMAECML